MPDKVLPVCLAHNLRQGNKDHRHRSPIDKTRTPLNLVLRGPSSLEAAIDLTKNIFDELAIRPPRIDSIMAVEFVFQPPEASNTTEFWDQCLAWTSAHYEFILSAVVHNDQTRPHMHVLVLPLVEGQLAGNTLTSGSNRFFAQRQSFMEHIRNTMGLRPDRKPRSLADLVVSAGRGPKNRAQADRRDAKLVRAAENRRRIAELGKGATERMNKDVYLIDPHAHNNPSTPLLNMATKLEEVFVLWRRPPPTAPRKRTQATHLVQMPNQSREAK